MVFFLLFRYTKHDSVQRVRGGATLQHVTLILSVKYVKSNKGTKIIIVNDVLVALTYTRKY